MLVLTKGFVTDTDVGFCQEPEESSALKTWDDFRAVVFSHWMFIGLVDSLNKCPIRHDLTDDCFCPSEDPETWLPPQCRMLSKARCRLLRRYSLLEGSSSCFSRCALRWLVSALFSTRPSITSEKWLSSSVKCVCLYGNAAFTPYVNDNITNLMSGQQSMNVDFCNGQGLLIFHSAFNTQ